MTERTVRKTRIENTDIAPMYGVRVQLWDKGQNAGTPQETQDTLVKEIYLYEALTSARYIIIKESV